MSEVDPTAAAHRRAVEEEDWDRVHELELELIEPTDNTERPDDGDQPSQDPDAVPPPGEDEDAAAGGEAP
jgi:hypothetical protein